MIELLCASSVLLMASLVLNITSMASNESWFLVRSRSVSGDDNNTTLVTVTYDLWRSCRYYYHVSLGHGNTFKAADATSCCLLVEDAERSYSSRLVAGRVQQALVAGTVCLCFACLVSLATHLYMHVRFDRATLSATAAPNSQAGFTRSKCSSSSQVAIYTLGSMRDALGKRRLACHKASDFQFDAHALDFGDGRSLIVARALVEYRLVGLHLLAIGVMASFELLMHSLALVAMSAPAWKWIEQQQHESLAMSKVSKGWPYWASLSSLGLTCALVLLIAIVSLVAANQLESTHQSSSHQQQQQQQQHHNPIRFIHRAGEAAAPTRQQHHHEHHHRTLSTFVSQSESCSSSSNGGLTPMAMFASYVRSDEIIESMFDVHMTHMEMETMRPRNFVHVPHAAAEAAATTAVMPLTSVSWISHWYRQPTSNSNSKSLQSIILKSSTSSHEATMWHRHAWTEWEDDNDDDDDGDKSNRYVKVTTLATRPKSSSKANVVSYLRSRSMSDLTLAVVKGADADRRDSDKVDAHFECEKETEEEEEEVKDWEKCWPAEEEEEEDEDSSSGLSEYVEDDDDIEEDESDEESIVVRRASVKAKYPSVVFRDDDDDDDGPSGGGVESSKKRRARQKHREHSHVVASDSTQSKKMSTTSTTSLASSSSSAAASTNTIGSECKKLDDDDDDDDDENFAKLIIREKIVYTTQF